MKLNHPLALIIVAGTMLTLSSALRADETDDSIVSSTKTTYVFKTYLKDDAIKTESKDGVVTLTGTVAEASHKSLAQDTVEGLPGVKSVNNQLKVTGEQPEEHSDLWIAMKVKTALLFHRNVRATKTDVNVSEGVVILSGEAASQAQKELTTEYASDIENVKEVKNQMTIAKVATEPTESMAEKIDDASITAMVKFTLLSHRSTSAVKTTVVTKNGVVTLSGVAKNAAEKSLVTKFATDTAGVTSVVNNMTVEKVAMLNRSKLSPPQNLQIAGN